MRSYTPWAALGIALSVASCVIEVNTDPRTAPPTDEEIRDRALEDIANGVEAELELLATDVSAMNAAGSRLFWLDAADALHSFDVATSHRVDYTFELGNFSPRFQVGVNEVVGFDGSEDPARIVAHVLDAPNLVVDAVDWPHAFLEGFAAHVPFAVDGSTVYLLDADDGLYRWRIGTGVVEPLFALADRGLTLSSGVRDLSVRGHDLLVVAGTILYRLHLDGGDAVPIADDLSSWSLDDGGALLEIRGALHRYSLSEGTTVDLGELLRDARFEVGHDATVNDLIGGEFAEHARSTEGYRWAQGRLLFWNTVGTFSFEPGTPVIEVLHFRRYAEPYEAAMIGRVAFLLRGVCTYDFAHCDPPAIFRRGF